MVAHRRAALSCSRRSPRGRTSDLGAPREPRVHRCTGSAAGKRGQRSALSFCLSAYCTRLQLPARAFVGYVDPVPCPGLTAPGALPLARAHLQLHRRAHQCYRRGWAFGCCQLPMLAPERALSFVQHSPDRKPGAGATLSCRLRLGARLALLFCAGVRLGAHRAAEVLRRARDDA